MKWLDEAILFRYFIQRSLKIRRLALADWSYIAIN